MSRLRGFRPSGAMLVAIAAVVIIATQAGTIH
jgi:hypothetical protein